ncbi:MAG: ABC transporter substrate-binding protein, partial [Dehalococcoidales bacterium]|nr:ABC transporter substrate-binding protein [Dehalococcoidales bacterium]
TSGRALTIDDVVFSLKRVCTEPTAYIKMNYPNLAKTAVITGDETTRTVTIECPDSEWINSITLFTDYVMIVPRDAAEQFGKGMDQWQNSIGTGPFVLTDYVSNSSLTFVRNHNYWGTNPIGPGKGDQLPYLEGVKMLVMTDTATRLSAMRTGKIDSTSGEYDDVKEFLDNPEIQYVKYVSDACLVIAMRTDKPDSPFSKKEVRQALTMATDFNKIKDEFYDGRAEILIWPISPEKESAKAYFPLEQLPANVQELYSHNVTKAKELLTAAGYPTGFNATIVTYNTATYVDYLSLVKNMWADIGVTLTIDAKDYATWISRIRNRNYDEMLWSSTSGAWAKMLNFNGTTFYNASYVNDARAVETAAQISEYVGLDEDKMAKLYHDLMPYVIEQCWVIAKPNPYTYVVWWPWRKNWHGELYVGYVNFPSYFKYIWQDVDLKFQMTGKK